MGAAGANHVKALLLLGALLVAGVSAILWTGLDEPTGPTEPADAAVEKPAEGNGASAAATATRGSGPAKAVAESEAAQVHGVVRLYRSKEPVAGLELTLGGADGSTRTATTQKDGSFRFEGLAAAPGYELRGARDPYAPIALPLDLVAKEDRDVGTLWLEVPVSLAAFVIDLTGKPLAGATVDVFAVSRAGTTASNDQNWWWDQRAWEQRVLAVVSNPKPTGTAKTDAAGKATVSGLMPGTYRVRASAAGHSTVTRGGILLAPDAAPSTVKLVLGPGHSLAGSVLDEKAKPVAGANVIASLGGEDWNIGLDKWSAATNEKGEFTVEGLAAGRMTIYLDRPGKPLLLVGSAGVPETTRYDIRLRPGGTIRGTVKDEKDQPIAGAAIRMAMQKSWSPMGATTGKDGKYELADIPAGPIAYFRVDCPGYMPYPDPSAPAQGQGETLREGAVMVRDVLLRRGLGAELRVKASDTGQPLEGCEITLLVAQQWGNASQPWRVTTDKEGTAKFTGLVPGSYLVVLKAPGYVQDGLPPWYANLLSSPDAMPAQYRLTVSGGEGGTAKGEYTLTRGAVVTGHVWDQEKRPVAGARVTVQGAVNEFPVFSDAEGKFRIDAVAPSNRCVASAIGPGATRGSSEPFIVRQGAPVENVDIKLGACGKVTGSVRTPDGRPTVGAMVRFVMGKLDEHNPWGFQQFQGAERFPVEPDGRFEIDGVPEGNVTVRADAEGYLPAWKNDVVVHANQTIGGAELILRNALEISGRVEAQQGGPVAGAQIFAQYAGQGNQRSWESFVTGLSGEPSAQTDANGNFTVKGLQEGNYVIWANAPGFASGSRANTKTGAGDVLIRLATGKKISGKVVDEAQNPVAGVPVSAARIESGQNDEWWWGGGSQVNTAPDGSFEMTELSDGTYDLTVTAMWASGREVNVEDTKLQGVTAGREDVTITVKSGAVIEGTITDRDGKPIRVAWLTAQFESPNNQNQEWRSTRWAQAKPDGTFRIVGLRPGPYTIWAYGSFKMATLKGVNAGTRDAKIVVEPGWAIWGRVVDVEGLSLASQANVQVRKSGEENWQWFNVVQPGDGNFVVLGLDQGSYDLQLTLGGGYAPKVVTNVTAGERELVVTIETGMEVSGVVLDPQGNAVQNANVWAQQLAPAKGSVPGQGSVQTDASGAFKLIGLPAGDYRVVVRARNFAPALVASVTAGSTGVRFVLEVGVSVSGSITDDSGNALSGVNANLQLSTQDNLPLAWINAKQDGTFEFRNVPSNQKWKLLGNAWNQTGTQWRIEYPDLVESGATDIKLVAKPAR
jgi:protocatechuate 3,4-dioxygenase beta subunit